MGQDCCTFGTIINVFKIPILFEASSFVESVWEVNNAGISPKYGLIGTYLDTEYSYSVY